MVEQKRRTYFIDRRVQGALVARTVAYWVLCLVTVIAALLVWRLLTGPARYFYTLFDDLWYQYSPVVIASLLLLPVVVIDTIHMSNRFAGPVFRLRRVMHDLANGQRVEPVRFRKGDFWHDMSHDFNQIAARLEALERQVAKDRELTAVGAGAEE